MTNLKTLTIMAAALLTAGTSLALAQNGPATGNEPPVAGGAYGNPILDKQSGARRAHHGRTYLYAQPHRSRQFKPKGAY
jgi:hypothetical protein